MTPDEAFSGQNKLARDSDVIVVMQEYLEKKAAEKDPRRGRKINSWRMEARSDRMDSESGRGSSWTGRG
jgi:hypothetical protein